MAVMPAATTKRITRLDREEAAAAMATAESVDLGPVTRGALVVVAVAVLTVFTSIVLPDPGGFDGPLQDGNVVAGATMTTILRSGDGVVSMGLFVPWNASEQTVVLEKLTPVGIEGDVEVVKAGLLPAGVAALQPTRGFPNRELSIVHVQGASIPPGTGPLDGAQIAVGLRGKGSVLGYVLRYRVDGAIRHALLMTGATLCTTPCEDEDAVAERQRALARALAGYVDAPIR
jgi:hypothetical protein